MRMHAGIRNVHEIFEKLLRVHVMIHRYSSQRGPGTRPQPKILACGQIVGKNPQLLEGHSKTQTHTVREHSTNFAHTITWTDKIFFEVQCLYLIVSNDFYIYKLLRLYCSH